MKLQSKEIKSQSKQLQIQSDVLESHSKRIKLQCEEIGKLKNELKEMSERPGYSGILLWELPNFNELLKKSLKDKDNSIHKHMFAMDGYKLKVYLRLNGDIYSRDNISIFISVVPGPFDDALEWPMKAKIMFSVVDVDGVGKNVNILYTNENNRVKKSFARPSGNDPGRGFARFIPHKGVPELLVNGKLVLKIVVKSSY